MQNVMTLCATRGSKFVLHVSAVKGKQHLTRVKTKVTEEIQTPFHGCKSVNTGSLNDPIFYGKLRTYSL